MAIATAIDCSYAGAAMNYEAVRAAGYTTVLRYLGGDSRCLTLPERDRIYAAGLRLGVIGQRGPVDRPRGGHTAGREDGAYFDITADRMGVPRHKPILCAVADVGDPDGTGPKPGFPLGSDLPAIDRFLQGLWETITRPVGIYGPYWVLEHFRDDPRVFCYWQSAGGSGPGLGTGGRIFNAGDGSWRRLSNLACMYQEYGSVVVAGTDHNAVLMPYEDFTYHPDTPGPGPASDPLEATVRKAVKIPADGQAIWQIVDGLRIVPFTDPDDVRMAELVGEIDGVVDLDAENDPTGALAARFKARYHATDTTTVHWGPVRLMIQGVARTIEAVRPLLPAPVDVEALAAAIAAKLATTLEVADQSITVDQLVDRIADELATRLAE